MMTEENKKISAKPTYRPPKALRLEENGTGKGFCFSGSSDFGDCQESGNMAGADCMDDGNFASSYCDAGMNAEY